MKLRWYFAIGILGILLLLGVAAVVFTQAKQTELESYKASLRANGETLTVAEWFTGPTNAADLTDFIHAVNNLEKSFSPGEIEWMRFTAPGQAVASATLDSVIQSSYRGTNQMKWATISDALKTSEEEFKVIRLLLRNPPSHLLGSYDDSSNLPETAFVQKRLAAHWLGVSAVNHIRDRNLEDAVDELRNLFGLARMHSADPTFVNHMIRTVIAGFSLHTTWECLNGTDAWTEPHLAALQREIETIDLIENFVKGTTSERVYGSLLYGEIRTQSDPSKSSIQMRLLGKYLHNDELYYLQEMQKRIDLARELKKGANPNDVLPLLKEHEVKLKQRRDSWRGYLHLFSLLAIPQFSKSAHLCLEGETQRRMTITAIVLKRHELRHGKLPPGLNSLVPEFLAAVPIDCMDGKPLKYKPESDGLFLLYSVGKDGKDDGGDPTPESKTNKQHNLWTGRDAVWPKAIR